MKRSTDHLIAQLAASAAPVKRLRPPLIRATFWLVAVAAAAAIGLPFFADFSLFAQRMADPKFVIETAATALTGIAGVIAAFELSVPDRSPAWAWLPAPPLALWLASSGYNCWRDWITVGDNGWHIGESGACFAAIIGFSLPLGATLFVLLLRARPLAPVQVAAEAGLGIAGLAAFFLAFNHPIDASFLDLGWHALAIGLVIATASTLGRLRQQRDAEELAREI